MAKEPERSGRGSRFLRLLVASGVLVGVLLVYNRVWGPGADDDDGKPPRPAEDGSAADGQPSGVEEQVTTTFSQPTAPVEPTCPAMDGSSPRQVAFTAPPPMCIDPARTYVATIDTNRGFFDVTMDATQAPNTVNNFVFLSLWHYYDGVGFHFVVPDFIVQGGDAVGPTPGTGGPGYELAAEPAALAATPLYPELSVAMANPNGSQFFIVVGPNGEASLQPNFSRFGTVTAGVPVVEEIEETGNADGTPPRDLTVIRRITIVER